MALIWDGYRQILDQGFEDTVGQWMSAVRMIRRSGVRLSTAALRFYEIVTRFFLQEADLADERYLYTYGEYISENEREIYRFLQSLPQETIDLMADTYTEGYRIGFELAG